VPTGLHRTISHRACLLPLVLLIRLTWYSTFSFADDRTSFSHITGIVSDVLGRPVVGAIVTLQAYNGRAIASAITNINGEYRIGGIGGGTYLLTARMRGFKPASIDILTPQRVGRQWNLALEAEQALTVPINASRIRAQNGLSSTGASKYTFTAKDISNLPEGEATPLNQVLLQMPGVALDQNQEIHIVASTWAFNIR
jgi:Carboxypeptidase regulatory-like domain